MPLSPRIGGGISSTHAAAMSPHDVFRRRSAILYLAGLGGVASPPRLSSRSPGARRPAFLRRAGVSVNPGAHLVGVPV